MVLKVGEVATPPSTAPKAPALTAGAARYQQAVANQLRKKTTAKEVATLRKSLTAADEQSLFEVAAFCMRDAASEDLKDPARRDNAEELLEMLERRELPAGPKLTLKLDGSAPVPVTHTRGSWKAS